MRLNLTREQLDALHAEHDRIVAHARKVFAEEFTVEEGDEDGEALRELWCDAFWQGALHITIESAKARVEEEGYDTERTV